MHTPTSPRRKRRHMADDPELDDSDDSGIEVEVIVDASRELLCMPKNKPQLRPPGRTQHRHKSRRFTQQHRLSSCLPSSRPSQCTRPRSSRPKPRRNNPRPSCPRLQFPRSLPLTILPEPARTEIATPPRALSHLHSLPDPPDPERTMPEMRQHAIQQGFCYEGAAVGAHGFLTPRCRTFPRFGLRRSYHHHYHQLCLCSCNRS
ncbi:hypothetical protein EDB84DRAFT_1198720 [Lactarius hengduanensis]|nr:hypothetical protein EDB84DRAFT_1198720 [Lactarius hengduanensis]